MQRRFAYAYPSLLSSLLFSSASLLLACSDPGEGSSEPDGGVAVDAPDGDAPPPLEPRCIAPRRDRQWGTNNDDLARVTIGSSGAVLVYGYDNGTLNDELTPTAGAHGFIDRWEGDTLKWSYTPPSGASVDAVAINSADQLEIVGRRYDGRQSDLVIGEITPFGSQWRMTRIGVAPSERPYALLVDGDHRAVVGHHDIYIPGSAVEGWQDPFVYRWDASAGVESGAFVRAATAGPDIATGAAIGPGGEVLVAGATEGSAGSFIRPVGTRFEAPRWRQPGALDYVRTIRRLADGDYVIAGTTSHALGGRGFGGQDVFVARLSPDLATTRWLTQLGSEGDDYAIDLQVDAAGRSWIVGETDGDFEGPAPGQGDILVAALDVDGRERWRSLRGSAGDDRPTSIAVDTCETVLVAGTTDGRLVPGFQPRRFDAFVINIAHDPTSSAQ